MNNFEKEIIINSVFGKNSVKLDSKYPDRRYFNYEKTGIYVVIDEEQCELKLLGYPKGQPISLSFAKYVHALFKNEENVKIGATLKQSFEEERGTTYYPLSKDDFLLEMNEIDWDKIVSLTWFSIFFEESDFEKVKDYVKKFKDKIEENMDKINEILSNNSDFEESSSDNSSSDLLKKIKDLMDEKIKKKETELSYLALNTKYSCLQYGYGDNNSEIWRSSKCHYEFNETKRPKNISICFHCEKNFGKEREILASLFKKDEDLQPKLIDWQGIDGAGICYANISTIGDVDEIAKNAVQKMLEFEGKYGKKIMALIQKSDDGSEIGHSKDKPMGKNKNEEIALNTILYGPPGTGKTFNTMAYAVAICEGKNVSEIKNEMQNNYDSVKKRYDALKKAGRIEFVTFHQSYGYEDFIEGIKPDLDNTTGELKYKLEVGCFKSFCDKVFGNFDEAWENLCDKLDDEEKEFLEIPYISDENKTFPIEWNASHNGLKAKGSHRFFNKKQLENVYKKEPGVKKRGHDNYRKAIVKFMQKECGLKEYNGSEKSENLNKVRVFIIDEINRGNISKIFGELITLIEPSKRIGAVEEMYVKLPCSGDEFGVPNNVYILGTMNTADRSIAMMDTALRRRFNFVEMMPDTSDYSPLNGKIIEGIDICKMLMTINKRIEYLYDREHTIGHAFFIGVNDFAGLSSVFRNKVLPLLQEYFYDDYEKISLVLGDEGKSEEHQFVTKKTPESNLFKRQVYDNGSDDEKYIYEVNEKAFDLPESYKGIA